MRYNTIYLNLKKLFNFIKIDSFVIYMNIFNELLLPSVFLLILDSIFIYTNKKLFADQIISVQRTALIVKPAGAILCYLLLIGSLYYFIIRKHCSPWDAFLFGITIYGVYETTTYALLKNWHIKTVIIDTLWGGVLLSSVTWLTYYFSKY